MTRTWPGSADPVESRCATRRVSTRVLPAPGPAMMQRGAPALVTAARCASSRSASRSIGVTLGRGWGTARDRSSLSPGPVENAGEASAHRRKPGQNAVRPRVAFGPKPSALLGAAPRSTPRRFPRTLRRSGAPGAPWPPCVPTFVDPPGGGRRLRRDSSRTPSAPPRPLAPSSAWLSPHSSRFPRAGRSLLGSTPCGVLLARLYPVRRAVHCASGGVTLPIRNTTVKRISATFDISG